MFYVLIHNSIINKKSFYIDVLRKEKNYSVRMKDLVKNFNKAKKSTKLLQSSKGSSE